MKNTMGIIYTSSDDFSLRDLTSLRAISALPLGGRYRVIDFILSSMVNSGIRNVGIIMQKNYHSLIDHLGSGKEWDLHTRVDGLFVLPPHLDQGSQGTYSGLIDALRSNLNYLRRSRQDYVVISGGAVVLNADLNPLVQQHIASGADLSVVYTRSTASDLSPAHTSHSHAFMHFDADNKLDAMEINPNVPSYDCLSLDLFIIKRKLLIYLVNLAAAQGHHHMYSDLIRTQLAANGIDIRGIEYAGLCRRVETVLGYYQLNKDMIDPAFRNELFVNPVCTKTRDEPPAKIMHGAVVKNSLIAEGCVIEGTVEDSVLFRGVRVEKGAVVRGCVLMQDSYVSSNAEVENAIFDKEVTIRTRGRLVGQPLYPIVVPKNTTL